MYTLYSFWCTSVFFATPALWNPIQRPPTWINPAIQDFLWVKCYEYSYVRRNPAWGCQKDKNPMDLLLRSLPCYRSFSVTLNNDCLRRTLEQTPFEIAFSWACEHGCRDNAKPAWSDKRLPRASSQTENRKRYPPGEKTDGTKRNIHFLNMGAMTITIVAKRNHGYPSLKLTYPPGN